MTRFVFQLVGGENGNELNNYEQFPWISQHVFLDEPIWIMSCRRKLRDLHSLKKEYLCNLNIFNKCFTFLFQGSSGSSSEKGYICDSDSDGDKVRQYYYFFFFLFVQYVFWQMYKTAFLSYLDNLLSNQNRRQKQDRSYFTPHSSLADYLAQVI